MGLIERLYPDDKESLSFRDLRWDQFRFLSPKMSYYRKDAIKALIVTGDPSLLIRQIRNSFFLQEMSDEDIEEKYRQAMNVGIGEVNEMCREFLDFEVSYDNVLQEMVEEPLKLGEFVLEGEEERRTSIPSYSKNRIKAYERIKALELANKVISIDEDQQVAGSIIAYREILKWFNSVLGGFDEERDEDLKYFSKSWETEDGVRVFGNGVPFKSRVKALDQKGNPTYGSMLAKMYDKLVFFDSMDDQIGVTFVTENEEDRMELMREMRTESKGTMRVEHYKRIKKEDMNIVKFNVRVPVPFYYQELGRRIHRLPVEVQVLTLDDYEASMETPGITHPDYKGERFHRIFPILFPKKIYGSALRDFV